MARILIGNIKGPKGDVGPQGKQGPVGPAGPQGPLPPLVNNGLTTVAGKSALDAAYGKTLADKDTALDKKITELNGNFSVKNINLSLISNQDWSIITALVLTYGKLAIVRIEATAKNVNDGWIKIGNGFPAPYFNSYYESSNNTGQYKVKIETDGSLFLSNRSKNVGTSIDTMFIYVLK